MNRLVWLAFPCATLWMAGCFVRPAPVVGVSTVSDGDYGTGYAYPSAPPPAPIAEYRPPPPAYGYVWVDGYWDWTGYDWAWTSGSWFPERQGYVYVRPQYVYESNRWVYRRSYWGSRDGRRDYDYGRPSGRGPGAYSAPAVRGAAPGAPAVRGAAPGYSQWPAQGNQGNGVRGAAPAPAYQQPAPNRGWGQPSAPAPQYTQPRPGMTPAPVAGPRPGMGNSQPGQFARPPATVYVPPQPQNPQGIQGRPGAFTPRMNSGSPGTYQQPAPRGNAATTMGGGGGVPTARGGSGAMGQSSAPRAAPQQPQSRPAPAQGQIKRGRPPGM